MHYSLQHGIIVLAWLLPRKACMAFRKGPFIYQRRNTQLKKDIKPFSCHQFFPFGKKKKETGRRMQPLETPLM